MTNVRPEFRRVELFIAGTVPNRAFLMPADPTDLDTEWPTPSPTPLSGTWQDETLPPDNRASRQTAREETSQISVLVCPVTGMRANSKCPEREARHFARGTEPKEFCTFHR